MTVETTEIHWNGGCVGVVHNPSIDHFFYFGRFEPKGTSLFARFQEAVDGGEEVIVAIGSSSLQGYCVSLESGEIELRLIP